MEKRGATGRVRRVAGALAGRASYANVTSTLALVIAVGTGGAYAASQIGPKDIKPNAVRAKHIKKNQVRAGHIRPNSVLAKHIRKNQVRGKHIRPGMVGTAKLRDGAVTGRKLAAGLLHAQGPAGGDLTGSYPNPIIARDVAGMPVAGAKISGAVGQVLGWFNRRGGQPTVEFQSTNGKDVTFPGVAVDPSTAIAVATPLGGNPGQVVVGFLDEETLRVRTANKTGTDTPIGFSLVVYDGAPGG